MWQGPSWMAQVHPHYSGGSGVFEEPPVPLLAHLLSALLGGVGRAALPLSSPLQDQQVLLFLVG